MNVLLHSFYMTLKKAVTANHATAQKEEPVIRVFRCIDDHYSIVRFA